MMDLFRSLPMAEVKRLGSHPKVALLGLSIAVDVLLSILPVGIGSAEDQRFLFFGDKLVVDGNSYVAISTLFSHALFQKVVPPFSHCAPEVKHCRGRFSNDANWTNILAPRQAHYMGYYFSTLEKGSPCMGDKKSSTLCGTTDRPALDFASDFNFGFGAVETGDDN